MSIIFGTTNSDGSGSSSDLNESNGITINAGEGSSDGVNYEIKGEGDYGFPFTSIEVDSDTWNGDDSKEIKIDESADYIKVDNFVDVQITNSATEGFSHIEVLNVKRGQIDTSASDSDDSIVLGVNANNDHWSNEFTIDSGAGSDMIKMANVNNSKYTEFDIDAGEGSDTVDVSGLEEAASSSQTRHIDGGEGLDFLVTNGDSTIEFEGFEVVQGNGFDQTLTLDSELLADNADVSLGLVVSNIDVEFSDDISGYEVSELSDAQQEYIDDLGFDTDDFSVVTVTTEDGNEYSLLTDDSSYAAM